MPSLSKVAVIILNWNQPELTAECVKSVVASNKKNLECEIVIVDNASSAKSLERLKTLLHATDYILLVNEVNKGFAGGNNVGIKYALENRADYVIVLNNDTRADRLLISQLVSNAVKDSKIGLVSPKIYFENGFEFHKDRYKNEELGKVIWYAGGKIDWNNIYGSPRGVNEIDKGQFDGFGGTDYATGTCMLIARGLIEKVGMFDERYYMYYEDTDLSERAKKSGFKVIYDPSAVVWHKVAQSSGIGSGLNDYYITRNRMLFGMKYARLRTKLALIRESIKLLLRGRLWQEIGIRDYYLGNLGRGSWK